MSYFSESEGHAVVEHLTALELVTVNTRSVIEREPRTVIHVKRAKMFDPRGLI